MYLITEDAVLKCDHKTGLVINRPSQNLVTISGRRILVENDPQGCTIKGCSNVAANNKPCTSTLVVQQGYSRLVRISEHPVCLDSISGKTDGTLPGTVDYTVSASGQSLVTEKV